MRYVKLTAALLAMGVLFLKGACAMAADTDEVAGVKSNAVATNPDRKATTAGDDEVAGIETKFGKIVIEFYDKDAPKTVANFKKLAKQGFYDGTTFHRIMQGFMIQGGDPLSKTPDNPNVGTGGPGYQIAAEFNTNKHVLGVISMARSSDPDSAGSQFFICLGDASSLDGQYTAFGKLIHGEEVLKKIGSVPTKMNRFGREQSVPEERVVIEKVTITTRADALKE